MAKRGRPNKYETYVKPNLKEIEKMCETMTEKQIAESLGVSYSSWCEYKNKYSELSEIIKKGRQNLVSELFSTMIKRAKGFRYSEKKTTKEMGIVVKEEITEKEALPDVGALHLLLKNYASDIWANDPQMLKLKEKEIELQQQKIENSQW